MKKLTNSISEKVLLLTALFGLVISIAPGIYIIPFEYLEELITGSIDVEITLGLITYFFVIPLIALSILIGACYLKYKKHNLTKLPLMLFEKIRGHVT